MIQWTNAGLVSDGKAVNFTILDPQSASLISKLKREDIVNGEVVKILDNKRIQLRLLNRDVIAESSLKFVEGEKLKFWVRKLGPPIVLEVLGKSVHPVSVHDAANSLIHLLHYAFNPLSKNPAKEFKKFVSEKKFLSQILSMLSRAKSSEKVIKALFGQKLETKDFLIPVYVLEDFFLVRGRVSQNKLAEQESSTFYFWVETLKMGIIEVQLTTSNKEIAIFIFTPDDQITSFIKSNVAMIKTAISNSNWVLREFGVKTRVGAINELPLLSGKIDVIG